MFRYFRKKTAIFLIIASILFILESFVAICETDFIRAMMNIAAFQGRDVNELVYPDLPLGDDNPYIGLAIGSPNIVALYQLGSLNLSLLTFGILIVGVIVGATGVWLSTKAISLYIAQMRTTVYQQIQKMSFEDIDKFSTSSLVTRLTTDVEIINVSVSFASIFMMGGLFSITFGIIKTAIDYSKWVFIYAIAIPVLILFIGVILYFAMPKMKKGQTHIDNINKNVRETILGIRVVKAYNLEKKQKEKFEKPNELLTRTWYKGYSLIGLLMPILQCVITGVVIVIYYSAWAKYDTANGANELVGFIGILMQVLFGFIIILVSIAQISRAIPCIKRVNEVAIYQPSLTFKKESSAEIKKGSIEFKNVFHSFLKDDEHNVLKNINLKINAKERVGIIGGTGSGKSTLINLIGRLFDPTHGEILIDGVNAKEYTFNEINSNVAIAMQSATLFSGTIQSNIALGLKDDLSEEELSRQVKEAAVAAEAWEFISKKDKQLNSVVEQRGKNFSGGQKQRISIARTIAKKSKIIIFDDSTSALDTVTERKVQKNIRTYNDATTIIVAQRISSVEELDRIIVMDNGEIVGYDSHWNLLANNDTYRSIAASQLGTEELNEILKERGLRPIEKK